MVSNKGTDEEERSSPRAQRGSLGRLMSRVASQLFGDDGVPPKPVTSEPVKQDESRGDAAVVSAPEQSDPRPGTVLKRSEQAKEAAQNLEQTLAHFESMLDALESQVHAGGPAAALGKRAAEPALNGAVERLERILNRLSTQAQRLSDGASDLAQVAGQMESRLGDVARAVREGAAAPRMVEAPTEAAPVETPEDVLEPEPVTPQAPAEPQFQPGDSAVDVVLAAVSGFQGLMDAQRALGALPQSEAASVTAFKNGEASLEVVLHSPVTAREIVWIRRSDKFGEDTERVPQPSEVTAAALVQACH